MDGAAEEIAAMPSYRYLRPPAQGRSLALYAMLFTMQGARSMFVVLVSWFALEITGGFASVGQVLICGQILVFAVGPFAGPFLDRFPRRSLFATGELIHAGGAGLAAVIVCMQLPNQASLTGLCASSGLVCLGSVLSYPSSQALLQQPGLANLARTASFAIACAQCGNILGSILAAICLPSLGITGSFVICALASSIAIICQGASMSGTWKALSGVLTSRP